MAPQVGLESPRKREFLSDHRKTGH
jgi:hypothetical protein